MKLIKRLFLFLPLLIVAINAQGQWHPQQTSPQISNSGGHDLMQLVSQDTGFYQIYNGTTEGLFSTIDNGQTWNNIFIRSLSFNFYNSKIGAVIKIGDTLLTTQNGGLTWQSSLYYPALYDLKYVDSSTIYCFTNGNRVINGANVNPKKLFRSTNRGLTWDTLQLPIDTVNNNLLELIELFPVSIDTIALLTRMQKGNYIYRTHDGGNSWDSTNINYTTRWGLYKGNFTYINDSSFFITSSYNDTVYKTTNNGNNYTSISFSPNSIADIDVINNHVVVACSTGTVTDSISLIARSTNLLSTYSFDTIYNYNKYPTGGIQAIEILSPTYGWATSFDRLYVQDTCDITSDFSYTNNGNGNYSFTNTSTGNYSEVKWAFGDGTTSNVSDTNHTFNANGVYVVVLAINSSTFNGSCTDYHIDTITVTGVQNPSLCKAGFVIYPDSTNGSISIVNSSTSNSAYFLWNFGDGDTSTLAFPTHLYSTNGPFNLCLTITDLNGCTDTYCDSIQNNGVVFSLLPGFTINVTSNGVLTSNSNISGKLSTIEIYPNPVISELTIIADSKIIEMKIYNITGQMVKRFNSNSNKIDVSDLSEGIYFLKMITDEGIISKKFKKMKSGY